MELWFETPQPKTCLPRWYTAQRSCSQKRIGSVFENVDIAFFISMTPARKEHAAGAQATRP